MPDWGAIVAVVLAGVGGLIWLVRLEGRVNLSDAAHARIQADLQEIKSDVKRLLMHSGHGEHP